jgi:hypothetical protein
VPRGTIDPAAFVAFLDEHTTVTRGGHPPRARKCINGVPITPNDNRVLRRWRSGAIKHITQQAADAFRARYGL